MGSSDERTGEAMSEPAAGTEPEWLWPREAARQLRVSMITLRVYAAAGKIAFRRTPGGTRQYSAADVARFAAPRPAAPDA